MIECRDCKNKVSQLAKSCPHCGMPEPGKKEREERQIRILGNLFGCLMCLIGLIYFFEEGAKGVIASIVPFYCALLAIPRTGRIINKFTEQKYKFSISGKSKLIVCILLFAITVKIHPSLDSSTKTNQPPEATKQGRTTELQIEAIQAGVADRNFTKSNVTWALHDSPLLVAVEIDDYNGDILESGDYKAELRDYQANTAETFDVIVAQKELAPSDCFSILRDAYSESYKSSIDSETYSHYAMGGMSGSSEIISLKKGEYIHIIPGTYYLNKIGSPQENKTSGVFYLSKIVQKF